MERLLEQLNIKYSTLTTRTLSWLLPGPRLQFWEVHQKKFMETCVLRCSGGQGHCLFVCEYGKFQPPSQILKRDPPYQL